DLYFIPWLRDDLALFGHPHDALAQKQQQQGFLTDADLRSARWMLREAGSGTRQAFDRALHGLLPELHVTLELQHTEAIKRAVEAGLGTGCLSLIPLGDA